jgi:magnesium transporter
MRRSGHDAHSISYVYLVDDHGALVGVVDLREIVLASDSILLREMMISPVVSAPSDSIREDLVDLFARYQFHLIPIVDEHDRLLGLYIIETS